MPGAWRWRITAAAAVMGVFCAGCHTGTVGIVHRPPTATKQVRFGHYLLAVPASWELLRWPLCGGPAEAPSVFLWPPAASGNVCIATAGSKPGAHVWLWPLSALGPTPTTTSTVTAPAGLTIGRFDIAGSAGASAYAVDGALGVAVTGTDPAPIIASLHRPSHP